MTTSNAIVSTSHASNLIIIMCIYLAIDLVYIHKSSNFYAKNTPFDSSNTRSLDKKVAALMSYVSLILGWAVFVTPLVRAMKTRSFARSRFLVLSSLIGMTYGFVVYGVFNFTNVFMFPTQYPWNVVVRDMSWGMTLSAIMTCLYALTLPS